MYICIFGGAWDISRYHSHMKLKAKAFELYHTRRYSWNDFPVGLISVSWRQALTTFNLPLSLFFPSPLPRHGF